MSETMVAPSCAHCRKGFEIGIQSFTFRGKAGSGMLHTYCLAKFAADYVQYQAGHDHLMDIVGATTVMTTPELLQMHAKPAP